MFRKFLGHLQTIKCIEKIKTTYRIVATAVFFLYIFVSFVFVIMFTEQNYRNIFLISQLKIIRGRMRQEIFPKII